MNKKQIKLSLTLLFLFGFLITSFYLGQSDYFKNIQVNKIGSKEFPKTSSDHDPISINGNLDFKAQALSEGWDGIGTREQPILIQNYTIYATLSNGIVKKNVVPWSFALSS